MTANHMNDKPLDPMPGDLASGQGSLPQKRRRPRWLSFLLIGMPLLIFVPYPTQVFPSMTLQVVDQNGKGLPISDSAHWRGVTNAATVEGSARFDTGGHISLPAQRVWASPIRHMLSDRGFLHKLVMTHGELHIDVPRGYVLDAEAMGLTSTPERTGNLPTSGDWLWQGIKTGGADVLCLNMYNPDRAGVRSYRIVLRDQSASTRPATQPGP